TKRRGGSHVVICPQGQVVPSTCSLYICPPSNSSMTPRVIGDLPMWCVRGHQLSKPSVNTRNACSALVLTVTLRRTDVSLVGVAIVVIAPPLFVPPLP